MQTNTKIILPILTIWAINCLLGITIAVKQVWMPYMLAGKDGYSSIQSDPFDGTVYPITYIPDWSKVVNQDKSKRFEDIPISEFMPIPRYDLSILSNDTGLSKTSNIARFTYVSLYMGNYRLNYKEDDGGHLGVDIRAPIGTPIMAIANGVVVRTVEADATGNKFVVIRHDQVPTGDNKKQTIYSCYLHLSEISLVEGKKVRKGDMIGRVGITGITTTPHLHLQIDTEDAPFHPYWHFSSAEAKSAGLSFFDAINVGLNKEKARQYTIHPLEFIHKYLAGNPNYSPTQSNNTNQAVNTPLPEPIVNTITLATREVKEKVCEKKRYNDVQSTSGLGKILYSLVDKKCIFQSSANVFNPKGSVTKREALITIMDFYGIKPSPSGSSNYLDIAIDDELQGYVDIFQKKGYAESNYFQPERILSREEFIEMLVTIARPQRNPSQMKIYADTDSLNPRLQSIQDYAYMTRARGGKIYPKLILNREMMAVLLSNIKNK